MSNQESLVESIRVAFSKNESFNLVTTYRKIKKNANKIYPVWINYEIAGCFMHDSKIKVITIIKQNNFNEEVSQEVFSQMRYDILHLIQRRIQKPMGNIEILLGFNNELKKNFFLTNINRRS